MVVGLGNPGDRYFYTRHNAGFMLADYLLQCIEPGAAFDNSVKFNAQFYKKGEVLVVKPLSFMNESGKVVAKFVRHFKIVPEQILVGHDDLDIKMGEYKIQKAIGPKDHNGLTSVIESLGSADFWRIRLGVDARAGSREMAPEVYVLQSMAEAELQVLRGAVKKATGELFDNYLNLDG